MEAGIPAKSKQSSFLILKYLFRPSDIVLEVEQATLYRTLSCFIPLRLGKKDLNIFRAAEEQLQF